MTSAARETVNDSADTAYFEVATATSDTLRGRLRVSGELTARTVGVLVSAIDAALTNGRRYLRVALDAVPCVDPDALPALLQAAEATTRLGGTLFWTGADAAVADQLRAAGLLVSTG